MPPDSPLLKALPPQTDYLTYLTIVEYNLNTENLPILHDILQDVSLTTNIGWDLVHVLLPLLPESSACLNDVARLGNPREVILKVTELLEDLAVGLKLVEGEYDGTEELNEVNGEVLSGAAPALHFTSPNTLKFTVLLNMLIILHPRIKTRYPSRFLSTSLRAIMLSYTSLARSQAASDAVLVLLDAFISPEEPFLPRATSEATLPQSYIAPDPEIRDETMDPSERGTQKRILLTSMTQIVEAFVESLPAIHGTSSMAWADRDYEKSRPERLIPGRKTLVSIFDEEEDFRWRDETMLRFLVRTPDLIQTSS